MKAAPCSWRQVTKRVDQLQYLFPGHTKNVLDVLVLKAAGEQIGGFHKATPSHRSRVDRGLSDALGDKTTYTQRLGI
jgi:hypothetical protein